MSTNVDPLLSAKMRLSSAKTQFLSSCDRSYYIPSGGDHEILMPVETQLLIALGDTQISDREKINALAAELDASTTYDVSIFAVRLAIFAARTGDSTILKTGLLPLIAAGLQLDWRDMLRALAIFENCAARIGCDFRQALECAIKPIQDESLLTTITGYFARSDEMREIDVMGFRQIGEGPELNFAPR